MEQETYQYDIFGNKILVSGKSVRKSVPESEYEEEESKRRKAGNEKRSWENRMAKTGRKQCTLKFE